MKNRPRPPGVPPLQPIEFECGVSLAFAGSRSCPHSIKPGSDARSCSSCAIERGDIAAPKRVERPSLLAAIERVRTATAADPEAHERGMRGAATKAKRKIVVDGGDDE